MLKTVKRKKEFWDLYTRREEYNNINLDIHQRFPYQESRFKDILEPKISKYLIKKGLKIHYPNKHKFAVCLTHDIDLLNPTWKYMMLTSLISGLNLKPSEGIKRFFNLKNPYCNFKKIIEIEKKYDAKSTFNFLATKKDNFSDGYKLEDFKNEIKNIIDEGFEIGLHGGYYSYNNLKNIKKEKKTLEEITHKRIIGYRNHYLRFKIPDTWNILKNAGFEYDSTLGYSNNFGFRNGMCHPFKPYNLNNNRYIDIFELPLALMDVTLFKYQNFSNTNILDTCKKMIDIVEKQNGVLTILWHNDSFDEIYFKNRVKIYEKILKICREKNAWITSAEEIIKWWKNNVKI